MLLKHKKPSRMKCFIFTFTFRFHRYAGIEEAMLRGTVSIPRLQTELKTEALVNYSPTKGYLQMSSSVGTHGNTVSKRVLLRYGMGKKIIHVYKL